MMTKVAEALMYGKNIVASVHALNGYEAIKDFGCNTAEEFIVKINSLIETGVERFNPMHRKLYEEKYSVEAMKNTLQSFFNARNRR